MTNLGALRKRFATVAWVFGGIAAFSALYLLFPFGASTAEARAELDLARLKRIEKDKEAAPLRGLPDKLAKSQTDAQKFYRGRLTARSSVVFTELGKMAKESGVTLTTAKYSTAEWDVPGLELVEIEAQVSGFYPQLAKFIHTVEQSREFYLIDGLALADLKSGTVKLDINVKTFLRQPMKGDVKAGEEQNDEERTPKGNKVKKVESKKG